METNSLLAAKVRGLTGLNPFLDSFLAFSAETGSYVVPILLVLLFLMRGRNREDSLFVFFTTVLGIGAAHFIQPLYVYERPFELYDTLLNDATGDAFPSQHASTLFPFSLAFLYRGRKKLGTVLLGWTLLNTFSRIAVGYHFPLDILAGLLIGVVMVLSMGVYQKPVEKLSDLTETVEKEILNQVKKFLNSNL